MPLNPQLESRTTTLVPSLSLLFTTVGGRRSAGRSLPPRYTLSHRALSPSSLRSLGT
uniref:Uncharacterized protein n=1 Tax=Helianthus annuus TaxID=4232 RepID=A0A251TXB8_HELAN